MTTLRDRLSTPRFASTSSMPTIAFLVAERVAELVSPERRATLGYDVELARYAGDGYAVLPVAKGSGEVERAIFWSFDVTTDEIVVYVDGEPRMEETHECDVTAPSGSAIRKTFPIGHIAGAARYIAREVVAAVEAR